MGLNLDTRILALALARMADALANSFLVVVLPLYIGSQVVSLPAFVGTTVQLGVAEFIVTPELLIGIVLSLFGFLNSFSQPFTGSLSDRTGRRTVFLLTGLALVAIGSAGYLVFTDYLSILVMRALQGIGAAFTIPVTVALVNELSADDERGGNFGLYNTFRLLGFGIGPLVAGVVVTAGPYAISGVEISGFDAAFLVAVAGAVISFVLIALLIDDPERTESEAADDISITIWNRDGPGLDPVFALGVATIVMALSIAMYAPLANVINDRLDQGTFLFSVQFGATVLANVVFQYPIGRLSDQYGRQPFLVGGFLLLLPTTLAQGFILSSGIMVLARFLQGIAVAAVFAPSLALAGDLAKDGQSGSTLSLLTMGFGLGIAFGALFSGVLVGFGFAVPFVAAAGLGVVGLYLVSTQVVETVSVTPLSGD
ncbi:MFS transporter [Haloferax mediterranei ATCC 33500]|uniref:MFS transporter n=1 Tax=Haloferax mediterranei (strain ATCC 33500 / DSM 1411 / JCM 8866 / NBRC 14739 / NCIMB 2177 / R-4) TaxID=523841 RepID=I3R496_HALMT|nr:MFS transporter [Haloferax mediterranei]AFK19056.1 major facilitator superfamily transporter quinolone resistance protein [Haloferax mediterranei ATCC 33500]AHZ21585.1 MFS transporter [Haloferax mediterranei ATCC 33500]EMA04049.1 major facilitator superfamily transporter quinolone resistance protein [Haloferax mediterranei ATCC 33500]MDX5989146.1 MFS transporter [Haloferax mediterranei ATCC 33500]QCQ75529.1 MFS transporter [Haloferax mediterranei ATCC 33500]